ncbi:MAG: hypothetical protein ACRCXX_14025 [Cetobacterium sp.]|uniref:hypothetical protein n=1 Tax=Cetobacterium sp. TaxID=2071632 RepID=UPI003F3B0368
MKKAILEGIIAGIIIMVIGYVLIPTSSTESKLMDKVAYKNMLLKNQEGGLVNYSDKLEKVNEEIKELRQQLAQENQKKRG